MGKDDKTITANFTLKLGEEHLPLSIAVPDKKVTVLELIPVYQALCDELVAHSHSVSATAGKTVACRAGCSSCCAQAVPVTTLEARHLATLVNTMPKGQQGRVRARFAASQRAIEEAGLAPAMRELPAVGKARLREVGREYFKLKLDCPFLENNRCLIYSQRPLQCREFAVTSDPLHCENLDAERIEHVDSSLRLVPALREQSEGLDKSDSMGWTILPYCLDWARDNRTRLKKKHAGRWLRELVGIAIGRRVSGAPQSAEGIE